MDKSLSLYKVTQALGEKIPFEYEIKKCNDSFYIQDKQNPLYIAPVFSKQPVQNKISEINESQVLLISASGATGKTELAKHLSSTYKAPIFDLGRHPAVASNSMTGLLSNSLGYTNFPAYVTNIQDGKSLLIIDALDEGYMNATSDGYFSFIDDLSEIIKDSKALSVVMLGRTNIVDYTAMYMDEKDIKVCLIQIEPFTKELAKNFIDKQVSNNGVNLTSAYKDVRDKIIKEVEGFLGKESDINNKQINRFIGYAPVLQAISRLLCKTTNFQKLLNELESDGSKNVGLIVDILERILDRERNEKVIPRLIQPLMEKPQNIKYIGLLEKAYGKEEQCYHLLSMIQGDTDDYELTGNPNFDGQYNRTLRLSLEDHPFLLNGRIQNVVFESYILVNLLEQPKYRDRAISYLTNNYKNNFIFYILYHALHNKDVYVPKDIVAYLYSSFRDLDKPGVSSSMEITCAEDQKDNDVCVCDVSYNSMSSEDEEDSQSFSLQIKKDERLALNDDISNILIDAPINISLGPNKIDCCGATTISCKSIYLNSREISYSMEDPTSERLVLECEDFTFNQLYSGEYNIHDKRNSNEPILIIRSREKPSYPFVGFWQCLDDNEEDVVPIQKAYHKLRNLMLLFRAHKKGDRARFCDKIDFRIGNTELGKKILDKLLNKGVLVRKDCRYYVDNDRQADILGVKYNDLQSSKLNEQTRKFLEEL